MTRILLGRIMGAHGIRGEVKIKSFTADSKAISSYGPLQTSEGSPIEILKLKSAQDHFICTLRNVPDRNAAEALKGTELFTTRDRLPSELLLADLVGKPVTFKSSVLGTIMGFQNFGAGELLELGNGILIPVAFITATGETVVVSLPDGYLDSE